MMKSILGLLLLVGISSAEYLRDDTKEIVLDTTTNLMWQDDATPAAMNWTAAISYCEGIGLAGYSDWRLPNFNELYMLADRSTHTPSISPVFQNVVGDAVGDIYWTSTTKDAVTTDAWGVDFNKGNDAVTNNFKTNSHYVRCVRPAAGN